MVIGRLLFPHCCCCSYQIPPHSSTFDFSSFSRTSYPWISLRSFSPTRVALHPRLAPSPRRSRLVGATRNRTHRLSPPHTGSEVTPASTSYEPSRVAAVRALRAVRGELAALQLEVAAVREEAAAKQSLTEEVETLRREVAAMREEAAEQQRLADEVASLQLEVASMREVASQKQSLADEVEALQWEVASLRADAAAAKQSLAGEMAVLRQQVYRAWEVAFMRKKDVQRVRGEVEEMKRELAAVKGVIGSDEDDSRDMWHKILAASQEAELELCGEASLTDAVLAHVAGMTRLSTLDLSNSSGFTTHGLQHLYAMPSLTSLILYGTPVGGGGDEAVSLDGIGAASSLDSLVLDNTSVRDGDLEPLTALTSLSDLSLDCCYNLTPALMLHVARLTGLEELSLGGCDMGDEVLPLLTCLRHLCSFTAPRGVTDAGLQHLLALPSLQRLSLCDCLGVTSAGMLHVGRLTSLRALSLPSTRVTNEGLQHLTALTDLVSLVLPPGVTDAGMVHVGRLTGLQVLSVYHTTVGEYGLQHLTALTQLESLDLADDTTIDRHELLTRLGWQDNKRGG
ncbi:unnamed protein product [Closterium sp. Yama58-4]|nr:unnamed protein product [Closterium sp. Yama58-4]